MNRTIFLFFFLFLVTLSSATWWNTGWNWAFPIVINSSVGSAQKNITYAISVNSSNTTLWNTTTCTNYRIVDSTNTTVMDSDVIFNTTSCGNATANLTILFNASLSDKTANTTYYLYLGNVSASNSTPTYNVWRDANYTGVYFPGESNKTLLIDHAGYQNMTMPLSSFDRLVNGTIYQYAQTFNNASMLNGWTSGLMGAAAIGGNPGGFTTIVTKYGAGAGENGLVALGTSGAGTSLDLDSTGTGFECFTGNFRANNGITGGTQWDRCAVNGSNGKNDTILTNGSNAVVAGNGATNQNTGNGDLRIGYGVQSGYGNGTVERAWFYNGTENQSDYLKLIDNQTIATNYTVGAILTFAQPVPAIAFPVLTPAGPNSSSTLNCQIQGNSTTQALLNYTLEWCKNGANQTSLNVSGTVANNTAINVSLVLSNAITSPGNNWSCNSTMNDSNGVSSDLPSNNVTVFNITIGQVSIAPNPPIILQNLTCYANASGSFSFYNVSYNWTKDGIIQASLSGTAQGIANNTNATINVINSALLTPLDNWSCTVQAFNQSWSSIKATSANVTDPDQIGFCQNLTIANNVYTLAANLSSSGICINITANNVTLNGNNATINGTVRTLANSTTIYNLKIDPAYGIILNASSNGNYSNLTLTSITKTGILADNSSNNNTFYNFSMSYGGGGFVAGINLYGSNNTFDCAARTIVQDVSTAGDLAYWDSGLGGQGNNNTLKNCVLTNASVDTGGNYSSFINNTFNDCDSGTAQCIEFEGVGNNVSLNTVNATDGGLTIISVSSAKNGTVANNTFIGNSTDGTAIEISTTNGNNLFYFNNFLSELYFINNTDATNRFNTTVGGFGAGNNYSNISLYNIIDSNGDGWGDSGTQYPANATNTPGIFTIGSLGNDSGPKVNLTFIYSNTTAIQTLAVPNASVRWRVTTTVSVGNGTCTYNASQLAIQPTSTIIDKNGNAITNLGNNTNLSWACINTASPYNISFFTENITQVASGPFPTSLGQNPVQINLTTSQNQGISYNLTLYTPSCASENIFLCTQSSIKNCDPTNSQLWNIQSFVGGGSPVVWLTAAQASNETAYILTCATGGAAGGGGGGGGGGAPSSSPFPQPIGGVNGTTEQPLVGLPTSEFVNGIVDFINQFLTSKIFGFIPVALLVFVVLMAVAIIALNEFDSTGGAALAILAIMSALMAFVVLGTYAYAIFGK